MNLTALLIPTLTNQLTALDAWLDKAAAHIAATGETERDLLLRRLAPDMFPLYGQLRFACFLSREAVHRLRHEETPAEIVALRTHGSSGRDEPDTISDHRRAIADTLAFLAAVQPDELDAAAAQPLAHALPMRDMVFDMTGATYVRDWALPQVAFHQVTAYAILRHAGVPLGKVDYVPHMWTYLRPGADPTA